MNEVDTLVLNNNAIIQGPSINITNQFNWNSGKVNISTLSMSGLFNITSGEAIDSSIVCESGSQGTSLNLILSNSSLEIKPDALFSV